MGRIEERLAELGLELPEPFTAPEGIEFKFELVRVAGEVAYVSGHGPIDGFRPLVQGKVGAEVTPERAYEAASRISFDGMQMRTDIAARATGGIAAAG